MGVQLLAQLLSQLLAPLLAQLFHADGQTDMTKLIVTFLKFANVPKNYITVVICLNFAYLERKYEQRYGHIKTNYLLTYLFTYSLEQIPS